MSTIVFGRIENLEGKVIWSAYYLVGFKRAIFAERDGPGAVGSEERRWGRNEQAVRMQELTVAIKHTYLD
jgi:hypothetical protein